MMLPILACAASTVMIGGDPTAPTVAPGPAWSEPPVETLSGTGETLLEPPEGELFGSSILPIELLIGGDAWRSLQRDGATWAEAQLRYEDWEGPVALHIKGSSTWTDIDDKPSLTVDVNRVLPDQEFMGVKRFNLHNQLYDPSMMSEQLSYGVLAAAGLPAPRSGYARLTINGDDYGLYSVVEALNDDWLERNFTDPNGNMYENTEAYCDVHERWCLEAEETDEGGDEALVRLGDAAVLEGDAWLGAVPPLLNWERFIDQLAVEVLIAHWDSYSYDLSNYHIYHEPTVDQWSILTQSMDLDFGYRPWSYPDCGQYGTDPARYNMGILAERCLALSDCREAWRAQLVVRAEWLGSLDLAGEVRALDERIRDDVRSDRRRNFSDREYEEHIACVQQWVERRPAEILAWVAADRSG